MTIEAEFDASPERVWQLWANPRQLERWWGPPKYPATFTRHDLAPIVISGDVAAAVGNLKGKPGGELQVHGCGTLLRWLLENDFIDEITLFTFPVVVGQGTPQYAD
jgi:dihydrofolate reductase